MPDTIAAILNAAISCDLRGEIAMLQYCFPNESIAGVYHTSQLALAK